MNLRLVGLGFMCADREITRRNKPDRNGHTRLLAVVLDERLVSAATIQSEITTRGQITGKFDGGGSASKACSGKGVAWRGD